MSQPFERLIDAIEGTIRQLLITASWRVLGRDWEEADDAFDDVLSAIAARRGYVLSPKPRLIFFSHSMGSVVVRENLLGISAVTQGIDLPPGSGKTRYMAEIARLVADWPKGG